MWKSLPADVLGGNVLSLLSLKDIVRLDQAALSREHREHFLQSLQYIPAFVLKSVSDSLLRWFTARQCRLKFPRVSVLQAILLRSELVEDVCLQTEGDVSAPVSDLKIKEKVTMINMILCNSTSSLIELLKSFNYVKTISIGNVSTIFLIEWMNRSNEVAGDIEDILALINYKHGVVNGLIKLKYTSGISMKIKKIFLDYIPDLTAITTASPRLRRLQLFCYCHNHLTDDIVDILVMSCPLLEEIHLDSLTATDRTVIAIAQHCPNLSSLQVIQGTYTHSSLIALSERGLTLKSLGLPWIRIPQRDLYRCTYALSQLRMVCTQNRQPIDRDDLLAMAQCCTLLESVNIVLVNNAVADVADALIALSRANSRTLHSVYVFCKATPHCLTSSQIAQLAQACPNVKKFCLHDVVNINDSCILTLSKHCPILEFLSITVNNSSAVEGSMGVSESALIRLVQHCEKIYIIRISSTELSAEAVERINTTKHDFNLMLA